MTTPTNEDRIRRADAAVLAYAAHARESIDDQSIDEWICDLICDLLHLNAASVTEPDHAALLLRASMHFNEEHGS